MNNHNSSTFKFLTQQTKKKMTSNELLSTEFDEIDWLSRFSISNQPIILITLILFMVWFLVNHIRLLWWNYCVKSINKREFFLLMFISGFLFNSYHSILYTHFNIFFIYVCSPHISIEMSPIIYKFFCNVSSCYLIFFLLIQFNFYPTGCNNLAMIIDDHLILFRWSQFHLFSTTGFMLWCFVLLQKFQHSFILLPHIFEKLFQFELWNYALDLAWLLLVGIVTCGLQIIYSSSYWPYLLFLASLPVGYSAVITCLSVLFAYFLLILGSGDWAEVATTGFTDDDDNAHETITNNRARNIYLHYTTAMILNKIGAEVKRVFDSPLVNKIISIQKAYPRSTLEIKLNYSINEQPLVSPLFFNPLFSIIFIAVFSKNIFCIAKNHFIRFISYPA